MPINNINVRLNKISLFLSATVLAIILVATSGESQSATKLGLTSYQAAKGFVPKDSLDKQTGLIIAPGFSIVKSTCVRCHSPKLITGKRATRDGWIATIRWMQKNQGLWDLGKDEAVIVDYLAKNYPLQNTGRRSALQNIKWYKL
jgi:hypothetical protein